MPGDSSSFDPHCSPLGPGESPVMPHSWGSEEQIMHLHRERLFVVNTWWDVCAVIIKSANP